MTYSRHGYRDHDEGDGPYFCPQCERPTQFGETCGSCQREIDDEVVANQSESLTPPWRGEFEA